MTRESPHAFLGRVVAERDYPGFPLLVKILDARETLSVQVHPDDRYAQEREDQPFGKSEAWYILDSEEDARLIHGVERPASRTEAADAIEAGRGLFPYPDCLRGSGQVMGVALGAGESLLIPAGIDEYQIEAKQPLRLIKAYVPDLMKDVLEPLRKRGTPDEAIAQLGGIARHSDLVPLLREG